MASVALIVSGIANSVGNAVTAFIAPASVWITRNLNETSNFDVVPAQTPQCRERYFRGCPHIRRCGSVLNDRAGLGAHNHPASASAIEKGHAISPDIVVDATLGSLIDDPSPDCSHECVRGEPEARRDQVRVDDKLCVLAAAVFGRGVAGLVDADGGLVRCHRVLVMLGRVLSPASCPIFARAQTVASAIGARTRSLSHTALDRRHTPAGGSLAGNDCSDA